MYNQEITIASLIVLLFFSSIAADAADNQKHPLHGSWTSQSESEEEVELIFYPDGSFHMSVTRGESWGVIAEEGYEDEEDSEAWAEFIAEADSNNNGVLDEDDFEAARDRGDEDMPPSWNDILAVFGDINGDGVINQEEYESAQNEDAEFADFMTAVFGEAMLATISITGTWGAVDDQLTLTSFDAVYEINGLSLGEFYTRFLDALFELAVQDSGEEISEEEWLLFMLLVYSMENEAEIDFGEETSVYSIDGDLVDVEELESLEELKALVIDQMVSLTMADIGRSINSTVYSIDTDEVTIAEVVGDETLVLTRLDASSAVKASSWGQIKALNR